MEINISDSNDVINIKLSGRLDTNTSFDLENSLKAILMENKDIVFDFAELDYITSAGLRIMLASYKRLKSNGHSLKILNASEVVQSVFVVTGMSTFFDFD